MKSSEKEGRAVSPVVGVILIVAITVILAAVIGTYVLDLGKDVDEPATAGAVDVSQPTSTHVELTVLDMGNSERIIIKRSDESSYSAELDEVGETLKIGDGSNDGSHNEVGDTGGFSSGAKITIIGEYNKKQNVIQIYEV